MIDEDDDPKMSTIEKRYLAVRRYANTQFTYGDASQLHEFSAKLPQLLSRISGSPREKHYVYSAFYSRSGAGGHGVHAIAAALKRELGYAQLTASHAVRLVDGKAPPLSPLKRFVILTSGELRGDTDSVRVETAAVEAIKDVFNADNNARGEMVHVILASQSFNEGVDLRAVRHVHFFEPLVNYGGELQAIGRAVRHCSHAQLNREFGEWTVDVHRYFSLAPPLRLKITNIDEIRLRIDGVQTMLRHARSANEMQSLAEELARLHDALAEAERSVDETRQTIDHVVYKEARERFRTMNLMQLAVKSAAVDCMLTREFFGRYGVPCIGSE